MDINLKEALSALASMWNQYCRPEDGGHQFMAAGEEAEIVLQKFGLMGADGLAVDPFDTSL